MRVTMAAPRDGHLPGDQVDVDDDLARVYVTDGHARYELHSAAEVEAAAAAEGVSLADTRTVADKKAAVKAAREESV